MIETGFVLNLSIRGNPVLQTGHRLVHEDARKMGSLNDETVDLVVTSPPYPMIEMWDDIFAGIDPECAKHLQEGDLNRAFQAMHAVLDEAWQELYRVMKPGALACINIGDATRSAGGRFRLFTNHSRILARFFELGFDVLPPVIWRKQTNAPNKFMGSGMLPAGAYVTLEHEYILIFRRGPKRLFVTAEEKAGRRQSSFFWEERNRWFSDLWDLKGARQESGYSPARSRSAAFPPALPFRLINMFSVLGDLVLDPFSGTGTTALAAAAAGRNSVSLEIDTRYMEIVKTRLMESLPGLNSYNLERIIGHLGFVRDYEVEKGSLKYNNRYFGFPVMTGQEVDLKLVFARSIKESAPASFQVSYFSDSYIQSLVPGNMDLGQLTDNGGVQASFTFQVD